ncbi:sciellin isoform X4 [Poecilia formosa]|uniref:Sciellin n=1 Tax=Poecilia formosa TaxID=48698 RepID=A0A087XU48_POEFO|nr:PREDICTED: sciellin isoform X4 [Poecilia formosa]
MSSYSTSKTKALEDSKKKTSLLKDNSWIRKTDDEDEPVDRDPNFGKSVLSRVNNTDTTDSSPEPKSTRTTKTSSSSSVQALSKRFSGSTDDLKTMTPSYYSKRTSCTKTETSSTTKSTTVTKDGTTETTVTTTQSVKSPVTKTPNKTETFMERVKSSSKDSQYSSYSPTKTTKPTIPTTKGAEDQLYNSLTQSPVKNDSPTKDSKTTVTTTETVTVKSSSDAKAEDKLYDSLLPDPIKSPDSSTTSTKTKTKTKTKKVDSSSETVTAKSSSDAIAEDKLYDTLIPSAIKDGDSKKTTVSSSEPVTVKSSNTVDDPKTTPTKTVTVKSSSTPTDDLYDTLLPKAITSPVSSSKTVKDIITVNTKKEDETPSTPSSTRSVSYSSNIDDTPYSPTSSYSSDYKSYSYSRPDSSYEYSSLNSPSLYSSTSYKSSSLSDDILSDPIYSKSSTKSVYQSPDRPVLEKDLCTTCRKPFTGDAKMVLDDMKINCHATCFKCDVCNGSLGYMKAGDSMWIYKRKVHCENCFENTREKWRR